MNAEGSASMAIMIDLNARYSNHELMKIENDKVSSTSDPNKGASSIINTILLSKSAQICRANEVPPSLSSPPSFHFHFQSPPSPSPRTNPSWGGLREVSGEVSERGRLRPISTSANFWMLNFWTTKGGAPKGWRVGGRGGGPRRVGQEGWGLPKDGGPERWAPEGSHLPTPPPLPPSPHPISLPPTHPNQPLTQNTPNRDNWQWDANGQCSKGDNCSFFHGINNRAKMTHRIRL